MAGANSSNRKLIADHPAGGNPVYWYNLHNESISQDEDSPPMNEVTFSDLCDDARSSMTDAAWIAAHPAAVESWLDDRSNEVSGWRDGARKVYPDGC